MKTMRNIGLGPSEAAPQGINLGRAVDTIMRTFGAAYLEFRTVTDGEPTVVVVLDDIRATSEVLFHKLAESLDQDCIAAFYVLAPGAGHGDLHGPKAAKWLPFDPTKFIFPTRNI